VTKFIKKNMKISCGALATHGLQVHPPLNGS